MWNRMKRLLIGSLLVFLLAGCNKGEEQQELLSADKEDFTYTVSEEVYAIAVDEDGLLYTIRHPLSETGQLVPGNIVEVYDTKGELVSQKELEFSTGDLWLPTIENETLYCISTDNLVNCVYAVNLSTWEAVRLAELPEYQYFEQMVLLDDYLYVLGQTGTSKNYALYSGVWFVNNQGEQICRVKVTEESPKAETMKVDFPIGIYKTAQNTLMIYQYTEEKGFCFLEFNPGEMTLTEHEWTHAEYARAAVSSCGEGFIYQKGSGVFYGTHTGTQVQLLPEDILLLRPAIYQKGFAFLLEMGHGGKVKRICVADIVRDNKEIRVLTDDSPNDFPFGCGYQMTTQQATADEFALKVLAQDSDFDLFVLDTRNDCAYNLKENGAFYALNDVEGVQEYLDACFPYIKELAYNEDGDIWMLPVDIDIPGIVYNKEFCAGQGVDYSSMNYMEFMEFIEKTEAEEPDKIDIRIGTILEPMLMQYVSKYDSFDTELFRSHLAKLKQIYTDATIWGKSSVYGASLGGGEPVDFYLSFEYNSEMFESVAEVPLASQAYAPSGFPKLEEGIGDVGTITLLAVNPASDNLKETLKYITEYCNYMLTVENSFVLADKSTYTMDNPFVQELYQFIAGGTIEFRMDEEVYEEVFWDYLEGKIELEDAIAEAERRRKAYTGE